MDLHAADILAISASAYERGLLCHQLGNTGQLPERKQSSRFDASV